MSSIGNLPILQVKWASSKRDAIQNKQSTCLWNNTSIISLFSVCVHSTTPNLRLETKAFITDRFISLILNGHSG